VHKLFSSEQIIIYFWMGCMYWYQCSCLDDYNYFRYKFLYSFIAL